MTRRNPVPLLFTALVLVLSLSALPAPAQTSQPAVEENFPELAGAEPVTGSSLVEGDLPPPYIDYTVRGFGVVQRLSLFGNGLAVYSRHFPEGSIRKRLLLPPAAVDEYRKLISTTALSRISSPVLSTTPTEARERIRVYDEQGKSVEREYDPAFVLTEELETVRHLVHDLMRIIAEDRELTNPMAGYTPFRGDQLLAEDYKRWEVVRIIEEIGFVELRCLSEPVREMIRASEIETRFLSYSRPAAAHRE